MAPKGCSMDLEERVFSLGYCRIAGVDEVGMGCLAGPVVAGAVLLNPKDFPTGIDDSKRLTQKARERLDRSIREKAFALSIGIATVEEIDTINIYHAARLAMKRAIEGLSIAPDYLLVDGRGKLDVAIPYQMVVGGDGISVSIGAASILAKVYRDNLMREFDEKFPGYGFASHKGYGSRSHREQIQARGQTPIHRKSFSWTPV